MSIHNIIILLIVLFGTMSNALSSEVPIKVSSFPTLADGALNNSELAFYIHTGTDKKTALLKFGSAPRNSNKIKWDIRLETPLETNESSTTLADFDGFSESTSIAFNVSRFSKYSRGDLKPLEKAIHKLCVEYAGFSLDAVDNCTTEDVKQYVIQKKDLNKICSKVTNEECIELAEKRKNEFIKRKKEKQFELLSERVINPSKATIFGITGQIGYQSFFYKDRATLSDQSVKEMPWKISAYYYQLRGHTTYGGGVELLESFHDSKNVVELCQPFGISSSSLTCSNTRLGAPIEQQRKLIYFQINHHSARQGLAFQVRGTYDFEEKEYGIKVPVYLMRNDKEALTGGIEFGWQSETDEVVAGLFIGKAFSLY